MNIDAEYRSSMDGPMEELAVTLFGVEGNSMDDHEIVAAATKRIKLLKELAIHHGADEKLLQIWLNHQ